MHPKVVLLIALFCAVLRLQAQNFAITGLDLLQEKKYIEVPFQFISGHMVIEIKFMGIFDLKFIFDTGAQNTVLFEKSYVDVFGLKPDRTIVLRGADMIGTIQASIVRNVKMQLKGSKQVERDILVLPTNFLKMEEIIGVNVIGILGAEFFRNTIVKVDFDRQMLTLHDPNKFNEKLMKGYKQVECEFIENKFYINTKVRINNNSNQKNLKLLLDTGAAMSFLVNTASDSTLSVPEKLLPSILGQGLGGPVLGYIGKVDQFKLDSFYFPNILTYFQDDNYIIVGNRADHRNGLLGTQVLSRFTIYVDYFRGRLFFRPSKHYNEDFKYDLSGMTLHAFGPNLNHFFIKAVLDNSPAQEVGLIAGDEILRIGFWGAWRYDLEDLSALLARKPGKKLTVVVKRQGIKITKEIVLRDLFRKEE